MLGFTRSPPGCAPRVPPPSGNNVTSRCTHLVAQPGMNESRECYPRLGCLGQRIGVSPSCNLHLTLEWNFQFDCSLIHVLCCFCCHPHKTVLGTESLKLMVGGFAVQFRLIDVLTLIQQHPGCGWTVQELQSQTPETRQHWHILLSLFVRAPRLCVPSQHLLFLDDCGELAMCSFLVTQGEAEASLLRVMLCLLAIQLSDQHENLWLKRWVWLKTQFDKPNMPNTNKSAAPTRKFPAMALRNGGPKDCYQPPKPWCHVVPPRCPWFRCLGGAHPVPRLHPCRSCGSGPKTGWSPNSESSVPGNRCLAGDTISQ